MARYDSDTQKFMSDVADSYDKPQESHTGKILARQGLRTIQDLTTAHKGELPAKLIRRAMSVATTLGERKHEHDHHQANNDYVEKTAGVKLYEFLNHHYKDSWHDWAPETMWQTLEHDGLNANDETKGYIQALQVISKTNLPFEEWHVFEKVGHALNGNEVNFGHVQPLELDESAYTIRILNMMRPKEEFEDDVLAYIAASAKEAGVVYLPEDLYPKGCQAFLDKMGNDITLRDIVAKVYPKESQEETALGIQLARLSEVLEYVKG